MIPSLHRVVAVLTTLGLPAPQPLHGQADTLDRVVTAQLGRGLNSGLVMGVMEDGEVALLRAWGTPSHDTDEPLTPDVLFPFPGLTEILLATTIRALDAAGTLNVAAPLDLYLQDLPRRLGRPTLDQLLTHTGGLDDFPPPPGADWQQVLDDLPAAAAFVEPGLVYSYSRYSYPLAARVLERITGLPLEEVVDRALLGPLGMTRTTFDLDTARVRGLARGYTVGRPPGDPVIPVAPRARSDGLPVAFTTVPDLLALLGARVGGRIRGLGPGADSAALREDGVFRDGALFRDGLSVDRYRGVERLSRRESAQGFGVVARVFPASRTVMVAWGNGFLPDPAADLVETRLLDATGLPPPETNASVPAGQGSDTIPPPVEWAGRYRNGEKIVLLERVGDTLVFFDGVRNLPVVPRGGGRWGFRLPDGRMGPLTFSLVRAGGRRFVILNGRAHVRQERRVP